MSMFCYQCQEAAGNEGCTVKGVCGKEPETANLQDLLIWVSKGISYFNVRAKEAGIQDEATGLFVIENLFSTITNANFDDEWFEDRIGESFEVRQDIREKYEAEAGSLSEKDLPAAATWRSHRVDDLY